MATEFPWAVFPLVGWGIGLTLHYLSGLRWADKTITDRQARIEQRAAATRGRPPDARRVQAGVPRPANLDGMEEHGHGHRHRIDLLAGALGWLAAIAAAGFLVAWVLTSRLGMRRTPYIAVLALVTGGLTWGYLAWSDTNLTSFATDRWGWGLVGAAVAGAILALVPSPAARPPPPGVAPDGRPGLGRRRLRHCRGGMCCGAAGAGRLAGLRRPRLDQLGRPVAGCRDRRHGGTSLAVIVVHHLGYRGFHTRAALGPVLVGCGLLSLAYLLMASPLAAVGGHIVLHTALVLRGIEMPPYATGGSPIVPLGHQRPTTAPATPVAETPRCPCSVRHGSGPRDRG